LLEHVGEELLHGCEQRIDGERHEILGALRSELRRGDESRCWCWRVVERIEVANRGANLFGQCGDGIGVG